MRWKFFIALVVIILAGGGGAGWYFFLREAAPEVVLQKMQQAMFKVRSLHSEAAFAAEIDLSELALEDADESLALFFPNEREITLNMLVTGDYAVDTEGLPVASQATVALFTSPAPLARLEAELRSIDKTNYFKLNDIGLFLPLDVSKVRGTWYRADALKKLAEYEERREEITGEPQKNQLDEMIKEIRLASTAAVFDVVEKLPDEKLDSVATYHYRVKLNIPETRAYVERIFEIVDFSSTEEGRAMLDRVMVEAENAAVELWIGKRDFLLYRSTIAWPFHYVVSEEEGESVDLAASLTVNNSKFNEPVTVTAPTDARDQQEFVQKLLGGFLGGLMGAGLPVTGDREVDNINTFTSDAGLFSSGGTAGESQATGDTDSDNDGLTDVQEKFWGSDFKNPDTDGDGYTDGAEVDNGYSPIGPGKLF